MTTSSTFNAADGDGYERMMGRWSRRLAQPFLDFAGVLPGEQVLDVGCGTGALAAALVEREPTLQVQAVDLSPIYIDHARARHAGPNVRFDLADACDLRLPNAHFDRVLSLLMLHFVPQPARAVAEMRRVARPGATVAAAVWDVRGGFVANRMFFDTAAALDPQAAERRAKNFTRPMTRPDELVQAWRAAGLQQVEGGTLSIRMAFADFDDYWSPYDGRDGPVAEYLAILAPADHARLKDAVRRAYLDGEPDGARSYAALAWAVRGVVPD